MSIKVSYQTTKQGKQVTIVAGNAAYKYHGLAEIPEDVRTQLRFFNYWDDIVEKLPITVHFNNVEKLQEAVVAAANGDLTPATIIMGSELGGGTLTFEGGVEIRVAPGTPHAAVERVRAAVDSALSPSSRPVCAHAPQGRTISNSDELLQAVGVDAMSDADMIALAPKHGQYWEQQDRDRLLGWFKQARRENRVLNVVKAGQLLGRTPYACLCQLIQHKVLSESTVYDLVSVMHEALGNVRRAAQISKRKKALGNPSAGHAFDDDNMPINDGQR